MKIKINEKLPDCEVFQLINEEPVKIKISSLFSKKKIILLGMPGAFTSVCSAKHLPSFINPVSYTHLTLPTTPYV